jgi:release factor glutamine methyltransferase
MTARSVVRGLRHARRKDGICPGRAITVSETVMRLRDAGVSAPVINAEVMLTRLLGLKVIDLYAEKIDISVEDYELLGQMIARRADGEPLQYITGRACFYGNDIIVKKGVFIPRPETEVLVDIVVSYAEKGLLQAVNCHSLFLDLCTGSGNIAISLTKLLTNCKIIGSDISETAIKTARKNARHHGLSGRIVFMKADLLSLPCGYERAFDMIICNPPYIRYRDMEGLSCEVKREPVEALRGGIDGMDFYRRIVKASPAFLKDKGLIALEIPDKSSAQIEDIINDSGNFSEIRFFNDLNHVKRVVTARRKY